MPDCLLPSSTSEPSIPIRAVAAADLDHVVGTLDRPAAEWLAANEFKADAGAVLPVPTSDGKPACILLGLGDPAADPCAALLPGVLPTRLPTGTYRLESGFDDPGSATLAFALGAYRFTRYHGNPSKIRLVTPASVESSPVAAIADGMWLARDLINTASNDMGPAELATAAKELAQRHDAEYVETVGGALLSANFPMIYAVGIAAAPSRAPRLVDVSWGEPDHPRVTLVGKGVCFDTGGLDIKPASGMLLMKKDMAGAASVLGLAHMIMASRLPVRLRVLIPAVENAISGAAFRPGDVLQSRKGLTVEIGNTDAEGRLVLGDALALASEDAPDLIVDLATLTGAARTALGPDVAAFYSFDDALAADLAAAGRSVADPLWRMPLWSPYMAMLESKFADINNAAATPFAGSITAALFLSRFVTRDGGWIHADVYGWNRSATPARPYGGEAHAIRALFTMIADRYG